MGKLGISNQQANECQDLVLTSDLTVQRSGPVQCSGDSHYLLQQDHSYIA